MKEIELALLFNDVILRLIKGFMKEMQKKAGVNHSLREGGGAKMASFWLNCS